MTQKLHVGNLSSHVTNQHLLDKFGRYGIVTFAAIMKDDLSGDSRGFGFVEMADSADAEQAIKWLNFSSFEGQVIAVSNFHSGHLSS